MAGTLRLRSTFRKEQNQELICSIKTNFCFSSQPHRRVEPAARAIRRRPTRADPGRPGRREASRSLRAAVRDESYGTREAIELLAVCSRGASRSRVPAAAALLVAGR